MKLQFKILKIHSSNYDSVDILAMQKNKGNGGFETTLYKNIINWKDIEVGDEFTGYAVGYAGIGLSNHPVSLTVPIFVKE
ncbi:hypothetical protein AZF37_07190 [endosymbiont 'TC1' of Trimyema compressum]|uniref:hypothetical protein n=1 Tax=endosymbiont 'TC1' of Trimyema compressum TaxID=243899 RepID=UPI0007F14A6C|nr:hypothetical protein [endosymbiont 'TC1' of Trimyema compressum]AMP20973.1 hypothetical protein AZF37_07190 [endosymbiont 'TC1' of Trimyema compressum]